MNAPRSDAAPATAQRRGLTVLLVGVSIALAWILQPFYGTILWGTVIALLFVPLFRRLLPRLKQRRTPAALLTLLVVLVVAILPLALVTAALAREATGVYERLQSGALSPSLYFRGLFNALPDWLSALLERFGLVDFNTQTRCGGDFDGTFMEGDAAALDRKSTRLNSSHAIPSRMPSSA